MGGKDEYVVRILEAVRRRALTNHLGQPTCPASKIDPDIHEFWATRGYCCPSCGAAR